MRATITVVQNIHLKFNEETKKRLEEYYQEAWDRKGVADLACLLRDFYTLSRIDGFADADEEGLTATAFVEDEYYEDIEIKEDDAT